MFLLYPKGEIYGNSTMILKKYGRLVLTWDNLTGLTCYVLNTHEIPISQYHSQKLREECLAGLTTCSEAFGIQDKPLFKESGIVMQLGMDGSLGIRFKDPAIELKQCQEFYRVLAEEMRDAFAAPADDKDDDDGEDNDDDESPASSARTVKVRHQDDEEEDFTAFFDLVDHLSGKKNCVPR